MENDTSYKLGQAYVEYGDIDSALIYLHRYYDYCQAADDDEGFGQASEALAICYQKYANQEMNFSRDFSFQKSGYRKKYQLSHQIPRKSLAQRRRCSIRACLQCPWIYS